MSWEFQGGHLRHLRHLQHLQHLRRLGATAGEREELLLYNENVFDIQAVQAGQAALPLPDEPFVACWEDWAAQARERGAFAVLSEHLPQLRFPIREGMSATEAYRAATRRGVPPESLPEATGLGLARPERVELALHSSPAGRIPVLTARGREELVALVQALGHRNEPFPVPDSQGALLLSGYNNWARVGALKREWEAGNPAGSPCGWGEQFARLQSRKELYQDRFILLSDGPYSAVPAADLGLAAEGGGETLERVFEDLHFRS